MTRFAPLAVLLAVLVAGCGLPPDSMAPVTPADTSVYRLGPGDQVRVITAGEESTSGQFRVDADGTIAIPLLGQMPAAGLTAAALSGRIAAALHEKRRLREPSVSVEVTAYRGLSVIGEVNRPGQYPYQPDMTVLVAVADAGGFTYRAVENRFSIRRTVAGHDEQGRAGPQTRLLPGDVVTVYDRQF